MKLIVLMLLFALALPLHAGEILGKISLLKVDGETAHETFENSLVYITGITTKAPSKPAIHIQKNKQFFPRVLPIVKGQSVTFWNHDKVQHNVFSTDLPTPFDLDRYPKGEQRTLTFDKIGNQDIYCNIHKDMLGNIHVLENHYFFVTKADGRFHIKGVPAGQYVLHAKHIFGGEQSQPITLEEDSSETVNMTLISTKIIRDLQTHKNKYGEQYESPEQLNDSDFYDDF